MPRSSNTPVFWEIFSIPSTAQKGILFIVGLSLLVYEALLHGGEPRWHLLMVYAGMMGFPLAVRADEIRADEREHQDEGSSRDA